MNSEEIIDKGQQQKEKKYFFLQKLVAYQEEKNCLHLLLEKGQLILQFLTADIIRVVMIRKDEKLDLNTTPALIEHGLYYENFSVEDRGNLLLVKTEKITVEIEKNKLSLSFYDQQGLVSSDYPGRALGWNGKEVRAWKKIQPQERFYGLGEKTGYLDKRGKKYVMWNTDVFEPHVPSTDPLYQSIPFLIGFNQGKAYGIYFDNSYKSYFDLGGEKEDYYSFWAEGGKLDYYFINGPGLKEVVSRYTELTGRMPLPPKWALGYHQSRYSYYPAEEVKALTSKFREKKIPCDAIHLDIHYMDGYRVFTWDETHFPEPAEMISELAENGFKIVTIIDPGVKKDPDYQVYQEGISRGYFCKYLDGRIYSGRVWPGESVFPDFTKKEVRNWWGELHGRLLEQGVKGIWNDMNEPAVFNESSTMDLSVFHDNDGKLGSHKCYHNLYSLLEGEATYQGMQKHTGERPFVLTRAGFAGIQRYAAVWTGDNRSFWEHLQLTLPMLMNLGLSGVSFSGTDVGGFTGDTDPELLTRWMQVGALMPFFRNHSTIGSKAQEPWAFGEKYEKIIKKYIKLRYSLLPHLYTLFYHSSLTGTPVFRPLLIEFPEDRNTYNLSDQFMIGDNILAAPIYQPDRDYRMVYLPEGNWFDFWTGEKYTGGRNILAEAPLEKMPLYVRASSMIARQEPEQFVGEKVVNELKIFIYPGDGIDFEYLLYDDDGYSYAYQEEEYNLYRFSCSTKDNKLEIFVTPEHSGYQSDISSYLLIIKDHKDEPRQVLVDGVENNSHSYLSAKGELEICVPADKKSNITIIA